MKENTVEQVFLAFLGLDLFLHESLICTHSPHTIQKEVGFRTCHRPGVSPGLQTLSISMRMMRVSVPFFTHRHAIYIHVGGWYVLVSRCEAFRDLFLIKQHNLSLISICLIWREKRHSWPPCLQARVPPHDWIFGLFLQADLHTNLPFWRQICTSLVSWEKTCLHTFPWYTPYLAISIWLTFPWT